MLLITRTLILDTNGFAEDRQAGSMFILKSLSAGGTIALTWLDEQYRNAGVVNGVGIGDKLHAGGEFLGYQIQGLAGASVTVLIGPDAADAGSTLQAALTIGHVISDAGSVCEVSNDVGNPLPVSGAVTTTETLAAALTDVAPVAVAAVIGPLLAAAPARKSFRVLNAGANPVALVGPAGTFANAAIVLLPGETWVEHDAAPAAWYCICAAALASTLNILTAA